ncbi:MAG: hypothetical protein AAF668_01970 [Pseudomonadota bacterium]
MIFYKEQFRILCVLISFFGSGVSAVAKMEFVDAKVVIDLLTDKATSEVTTLDGQVRTLESARELTDGAFVKLDLRIVVNGEQQNAIVKRLDQGFRSEPAGCRPGAFGPMEMGEGLKYAFDLSALSADKKQPIGGATGTIYPGARAVHWANEVFCEFDPALGEGAAVIRFNGFFYVIHRNTDAGLNVQMRALELTAGQIYEFGRDQGLIAPR